LRMRFIGRCLVRFSRLIRSIQCSRMFFPQLKLGTTSCGRCQRPTTRLPDSLALARLSRSKLFGLTQCAISSLVLKWRLRLEKCQGSARASSPQDLG